eukprot:9433712-Prorocentrum_lima.AAC.1
MCSSSSFFSSLAGGGERRGGVTRHSVPNGVGEGTRKCCGWHPPSFSSRCYPCSEHFFVSSLVSRDQQSWP